MAAKSPLVTYDKLSFGQQCIYQAFVSAEHAYTADAMALMVNAKGYDADDGMAVVILAARFGFRLGLLCTGNYFREEIAFTPGAHYIVVITDAAGSARVAGLYRNYATHGVDTDDRPLYDKRLDDLTWHAVHAYAGGKDFKHLVWADAQKVRAKGPNIGDCVVYYEKLP